MSKFAEMDGNMGKEEMGAGYSDVTAWFVTQRGNQINVYNDRNDEFQGKIPDDYRNGLDETTCREN